MIRSIIEAESNQQPDHLKSGALNYVEVDLSSPIIGDLGTQYGISSMPTLLSFSRGEPQVDTKVTKLANLKNRDFLLRWLDEERNRGGNAGSGGGWFR